MENNFLSSIKEPFEFLVLEYNYELIEFDHSEWHVHLFYKNELVGVEIDFQRKEYSLAVFLNELRSGEILDKPHPHKIKDGAEISYSTLDLILDIRNQEAKIKPGYLYFEEHQIPETGDFFMHYAEAHAKNLRIYANDVLKGNFSIFAETEREIKRRAQFWRD